MAKRACVRELRLKISLVEVAAAFPETLKSTMLQRSGKGTGLKLRNKLTVFFAVYIIALSFIPLVHETLLSHQRWMGYGTGAYQYQNQHYFILFNDPYDGSSKPHIHLNPGFAPAARISLLEFSDWTSWVNDHNLFNEFNATLRTNLGALNVTYTRPDIVIHKFVEASPDAVKVTLISDREFRAHLEVWRWVMTSINGISIEDAPKPLVIAPTRLIEFTFEDERLQTLGHGSIVLSAPASEVKIWPHEKGFNKITFDFVNSEMSFIISGSMEAAATRLPPWSYALLPYVLPVVAVFVVASYLLVEKYGRTLKSRGTGRSS